MFLEKVVADVLATYPEVAPENLVFVVPNKRAILFLKKYFAKQIASPSQSPTFLSMNEFVEDISQFQITSEMSLLFEFYHTYITHTTTEIDNFETFIGWGQTILQDFNDIDQYLIDTKSIFPYIKAIKEVEHWSLSSELTPMQEKHLAFWNTLGDYYYAFTEKLTQKKQGYQGFVYRKAVENIDSYIKKSAEKVHIFVGFNALSKSQEHIIHNILLNLPSEIYWDIDELFFKQEHHDAGLFIRQYFNSWKYYNNREIKWISTDFFSEEKQINIAGVPKSVNQAHYVGRCLKDIPQSQWEKTAIILADENLLLPVLQSIDNQTFPINITMGYPLKQTPLSDLFGAYFKLYLSHSWYHKDVESLLTQPYLKTLFSENYTQKTLKKIRTKNWVYISRQNLTEFAQNQDIELLNILFLEPKNATSENLLTHIFSLIYLLKNHFEIHRKENMFLLEYLYRFYQLFNQLHDLQKQFSFLTTPKSLFYLYNDLLVKQTLVFEGEPLQGLQLMGMLESQNLDFENLIIISLNEGILPSGKTGNSFIPFDVKNNLGLPTYKHRDAIFTYHFYRLLQRAKNIHLIYNTENDALKGNEKSRFIMQLIASGYENLQITQGVWAPQVISQKQQLIAIEKDDSVIERLKEISSQDGFSPSALTVYVRNPIDFYTQTILKIREERNVEEIIEARTFGNIVHTTLEELYKPYLGKILTTENFESMKSLSKEIIEQNFRKNYKEEAYDTGKNLLIFNVVQEYIQRFLNMEQKTVTITEIQLLELEKPLKVSVKFPEFDFPIAFNGTADRIERRNGQLYIVDYKTGKVEKSQVSLAQEHFDNLINDFKFSKAFQLLMYAYMIEKSNLYTDNELFVGNYSFKNLESGFIGFRLKGEEISAITPDITALFEQELKELLLEIFNENIPFQEKKI